MSARERLPRSFWLLLVGMWVNRVGGFVLPFLSLYLSEREGLAPRDVSLVLGAWGAGTMLSALVGGALADRLGRKPTMMLSLCGGAIALAALGNAHGSLGLSSAALALGALGELYRPAVAAAVADLVPESGRARAYSYLNWTFNLAFAASPLLASWIVERHGWNWLFLGDAATMLLAALVILRGVPETRPPPERMRATRADWLAPARDARMAWMLIAALGIGLVIVQSFSSVGPMVRADGLDPRKLGLLFAANGALIALLQPLAVPRLARWPLARVLPLASLLFALGFSGHALAASFSGHLACVVAWTLGEIALFPLCNAHVAGLAPPELRGRYQGAYWFAWSCANLVGPLLGLGLLERGGRPFWALLPLALAALVPLALMRATRPPKPAPGSGLRSP